MKEIVSAMLDFLTRKPDFSSDIKEEKQKYAWDKLVSTINAMNLLTKD